MTCNSKELPVWPSREIPTRTQIPTHDRGLSGDHASRPDDAAKSIRAQVRRNSGLYAITNSAALTQAECLSRVAPTPPPCVKQQCHVLVVRLGDSRTNKRR